MAIKTPEEPMLPSPWKDLEGWRRQLLDAIKALLKDVRVDIDQGHSQFTQVDATPTIQGVDEGEFKLFDDGTTRRVYTRIAGALYFADLTRLEGMRLLEDNSYRLLEDGSYRLLEG